MAKYLLDTNHASPLVTTGHPLRARFKEHLESGDKFFIAAPALTELWFGFLHTPRSHANRAEWEQLETVIGTFNIDATDAKTAASLRYVLRRKGNVLQVIDSLIAAVAIRFEITLLTTDQDFIPVPGLKTENWIKRPPK